MSDEYDYIGSEANASPLWGHVAESPEGDLLLPSWWWEQRRHRDDYPGGWWSRPLNPRCPWHWPSLLRLRLTRSVVMVDS